jgi:hypothetical protein
MIQRVLILSSLCLFFAIPLFSQEMRADTGSHRKKSMHLVGIQANALFRQIFNFGNANNPVNNPYLLTYNFINRKSKLGAELGMGYTLNNIIENDGNTKKDNDINDLYLRVGISKMVPLSRLFSATVHLHFLFDLLNSKTFTETNFGSQITRVNSNTSSLRYGAGPTLALRFKLSNRVFLGTEASYYFKTGNNKSKFSSVTLINGVPMDNQYSESDNDLTQFLFNVPTAIFLSIRM